MPVYVQSLLLVLVPILVLAGIGFYLVRRLKRQLELPPPIQLQTGEPASGGRIGSYVLESRIGEGGTATVYRVRATDGGAHALKLLKVGELPEPEEFRKRMGREVRILQELDHPGIVRILDWGQSSFGPYLVEELVTGASLADVLPLPLPEFMRIFRQLLEAVAHAHGHGIVHRDLKPVNILLPPGEVKITDFGLARSDFMTMLTGNNAMGTPAYMAPELFNGDKAVPASDQYSLGVMAWQMLSGRLPFPQASFMQLMGAHCMQPPPPLSGVPEKLSAMVMRMLEKKIDARYASLEAVLSALTEVPSA
ncbi:MAG: serine/threonine-protein kinase [Candidatus Xenobia bacterium]